MITLACQTVRLRPRAPEAQKDGDAAALNDFSVIQLCVQAPLWRWNRWSAKMHALAAERAGRITMPLCGHPQLAPNALVAAEMTLMIHGASVMT